MPSNPHSPRRTPRQQPLLVGTVVAVQPVVRRHDARAPHWTHCSKAAADLAERPLVDDRVDRVALPLRLVAGECLTVATTPSLWTPATYSTPRTPDRQGSSRRTRTSGRRAGRAGVDGRSEQHLTPAWARASRPSSGPTSSVQLGAQVAPRAEPWKGERRRAGHSPAATGAVRTVGHSPGRDPEPRDASVVHMSTPAVRVAFSSRVIAASSDASWSPSAIASPEQLAAHSLNDSGDTGLLRRRFV